MIYLREKPIFYTRKTNRDVRRRMEPVAEDATGAVLAWLTAVIAVLLLAFLASPWCPEWLFIPRAAAEVVRLENPESNLNVRKGPGTEYDVSFMTCDGAEVTVLDEQDGWAQVIWKGYEGRKEPMGWVWAEYLQED